MYKVVLAIFVIRMFSNDRRINGKKKKKCYKSKQDMFCEILQQYATYVWYRQLLRRM